MPTTEGSVETGWLVLFSQSETTTIAESVGKISPLIGLVPEPHTVAALTAASLILAAAAKRANQKGLSLGVLVRSPTHLSAPKWLPTLTLMSIAPIPFLYSEADPASSDRWRQKLKSARQ